MADKYKQFTALLVLNHTLCCSTTSFASMFEKIGGYKDICYSNR